MLGDSLRRGLTAGLLAGLLAGLFALVIGEIPLREAIELEEQAAAAHADPTSSSDHDHDEAAEFPVSRTAQQAMLPVASALVGAAFGGIFGLCFCFIRRRMRESDDWRASLKLGSAAFASVALFPSIKYPANPPAVGDPNTIGSRSGWFIAAVFIAAAVAFGLWWFAVWLRKRDLNEIPRQLVVAVAAAMAFGLLFLVLPSTREPIEIPASLVWDFRVASLGTQVVLWATLSAAFGWLWSRAGQKSQRIRSVA